MKWSHSEARGSMRRKGFRRKITSFSLSAAGFGFGLGVEGYDDERRVAVDLLRFLENRRVLYNPGYFEMPDHCIRSAVEIRHELVQCMRRLPEQSHLVSALKDMARITRGLQDGLDNVQMATGDAWRREHWQRLNDELSRFREMFGDYIYELAQACEVDVSEDLVKILPVKDGEG